MSQEERFGYRDLIYSAWHRRGSTQRFIGIERAQLLAMIDIDCSIFVECDDGTHEPLALIEAARDIGQPHKAHSILKALARRTQPVVPAYVLLYRPSLKQRNPADKRHVDIEQFRYRRIWPEPRNAAEMGFAVVSPQEWAEKLLRLRDWSAKTIDRSIRDRGGNGNQPGLGF